jgi:hypothetical protein
MARTSAIGATKARRLERSLTRRAVLMLVLAVALGGFYVAKAAEAGDRADAAVPLDDGTARGD